MSKNKNNAERKFKNNEVLRWILCYSPMLIAMLIMVPRLLSPHFSLFDDARTMATLRQVANHVWNMEWDYQAGRFTPIWWLIFSQIYALFGANPFWYFFSNTMLLICTTMAIIHTVFRLTNNRVQSFLSGLLFVLASPVIENYFTISKSEPLQLLWFSLLLVFWSTSFFAKGRKEIILVFLMSLIIIFANLTKELSLIILPISAAWFLITWCMKKLTKSPERITPYRNLLIAAILGCVVSYILRRLFLGIDLTAGTYTHNYDFYFPQIVAQGIRWFRWLLRDYAYLLPIIILSLVSFFKSKESSYILLVLNLLTWMIGWLVVYLPWIFAPEYYLLPFALGASILGGIALERSIRLFIQSRMINRIWLGALNLLSIILLISTLANNVSNAAIQLAEDAADAEMLDYLAHNAKYRSTIVVNIQEPNEYTDMVGPYLAEFHNRSDLTVTFLIPSDHPSGQVYIATPFIQNQPTLAVRLGVYESSLSAWNQMLPEYLGKDISPIWNVEHTARLWIVDLPWLLCPLAPDSSYCQRSDSLFNHHLFRYGWSIYRVENP